MRLKPNLWLVIFVLALASALAHAQAPATAPGSAPASAPTKGKIHGHAQDPSGTPMPNMQVRISTDGKNALYTFPTDQNGNYSGEVAPGTYIVMLVVPPEKAVDGFTGVKIAAGDDLTKDFDLSRPDFVAKLPPDVRKQIEETKKKNEAIANENKNVSKLNGMLKEARDDTAQKKYDDAAALMQQAVQIKPDAAVLWLTLGMAQNGQKKYDDALVSLKKAIDLNTASKKPNPDVEAAADNGMGEAYADTNKIADAAASYDQAAKVAPANAGMYYTNEAIVLSRASQPDATVAAADKAIAADPTRPIPYYLKGQALVSKASVDPKTQKIVAPPGTVEAYKKYLELAPNGPMAPEVQQILGEIGGQVTSSYSASKGKH